MKCRKCGTELRKDALYCHECGQPKDGPFKCSNCGAELQDDQKFCPFCGTSALSLEEVNKELEKVEKIEEVEEVTPVVENVLEKETIEEEHFENENIELVEKEETSILLREKFKIIIAFLLIVQMILFESKLLQSSTSIAGISSSEGIKLSEFLQYPEWLFYLCNVVSIAVLGYMFYKKNDVTPNFIKYLPALLNLVYPITIGISYLDFKNNNSLVSSAMSLGSSLISSLGGSMKLSPSFSCIVLIISIIVVEILAIKEAKK